MSYLCIAFEKNKCPDGGIGRRAGLKHQWGNPSRFDPGSGYKERKLRLSLFFLYAYRAV